MAQQHTCRTLP